VALGGSWIPAPSCLEVRGLEGKVGRLYFAELRLGFKHTDGMAAAGECDCGAELYSFVSVWCWYIFALWGCYGLQTPARPPPIMRKWSGNFGVLIMSKISYVFRYYYEMQG
jgi:hypothetical protein